MRAALMLLPLAACATTAPRTKMPAAEAFSETSSTAAMTVLGRGRECEFDARALQASSRERAWGALQACLAAGQLTPLAVLLDFWQPELHDRPEASRVLAQVLAADSYLQTNLQLLQRRGVPVFDLSTAMTRPEVYQGRLVAFMGEVRQAAGDRGLMLAELVSTTERVEVPLGAQRTVDTTLAAPGTVLETDRTAFGQSEVRYLQRTEESGRDIIARLSAPSLFLSVERPHLFLARFRGVQQLDPKLDEHAAVVDVVNYQDLSAW